MSASVATERLVRGVGESVPRVDGIPKAIGALEYASDLWAEGMLHGATTRSPFASARILSIDTGPALAVPGVRAVLTAEAVPGKPTFGLEFDDQPVLASDVIRFEGRWLMPPRRTGRLRGVLRSCRRAVRGPSASSTWRSAPA
jgi:CO/xanthine dehydrogenase Mo-binding subunit